MSEADYVLLYELLEIDDRRLLSVGEANKLIDEKLKDWNKDRQHSTKGTKTRLNIERLNKVKGMLSDSGLAEWHAQHDDRRRARNQARIDLLIGEIQFAGRNGQIIDAEITAWKKQYADVAKENEIERLVAQHGERERPDQQSLSFQIGQAEELLKMLGRQSLFDVIGVPETAGDESAILGAETTYDKAIKKAPYSVEAEIKTQLMSKAKIIFGDSAQSAAYRTHFQRQRFYQTYLQPFETTCQATRVITAPQADYIVSLAEKSKMKADEARAMLFTVATQHGWRVLAAAETTSERDADLQKQLSEYMDKVAEEQKRAAKAEDKARALQQDIDRQNRLIGDLKHQAGTSDATAKDAQQRLDEALVKQRRLQEQLADVTRGEQERLRARVANRAPTFSAHLQRRELVAALEVAREFAQIPEAWSSDVTRCKRDILAAERLLAEAARLLPSSPSQAEAKASEALALCADLEAAKTFLASIGIAPMSGLRAVVEGRAVRLTWNPSPSRDVTYVVVRSTERAPHTPQDGKQFGVFSQVEWLDRDPPAGRTLWYAVFAMRGSASSVAAPLTEPLYLRPDVDNVRVETSDHLVKLTWDYPPGTRNVILVRNDDHMPTSHLDGATHRLGPKSDFTDPDVENGRQYFYKVYCAYEDAQGQQRYSAGVGISATPEPLPSHMPSLSIDGADNSLGRRAIVITAESPERGRLVIYRTKQVISLAPGTRTMMEAVETLLGSDWKEIKDGKDQLWSAGTYYYVPILEFQGTAIVGEPHVYVYQGKSA